jgi:hypothetical protein
MAPETPSIEADAAPRESIEMKTRNSASIPSKRLGL